MVKYKKYGSSKWKNKLLKNCLLHMLNKFSIRLKEEMQKAVSSWEDLLSSDIIIKKIKKRPNSGI